MGKFKKIESIKKIQKYGLPTPKTVFVFDFKRQQREIEAFLKSRKYVMIRSDSKDDTDFCPHNLSCPKLEAKKFIKDLLVKNYAILLQEHVPWTDDKLSGNILVLKNYFIVELMEGGPLILLNRDGQVDECLRIRKRGLCEVEHLGKRLISPSEIIDVLKMVKDVPSYRIVEFTIGQGWTYFWQIREDETTKKLEPLKS